MTENYQTFTPFSRHNQQKSERYRLTKPSITLATVCLSNTLFNTKKQTLPYVTAKTPYLIATSTRKEVQIIDLQGLHAQGTLHLLLTTLIQHRHFSQQIRNFSKALAPNRKQ